MNQSKSNNDALKIKIVIVGDSGTGKTNIKNRLCAASFREFSNPTVGVQLASRKFWGLFQGKESVYEMVLWDFGANLYDEAILAVFFKNALGVVYIYDTTKHQTFLHLQDWRQRVVKHINNQNYSEMILGNKTDLNNFKQIKSEQVQKWAIKQRIQLTFEISALQNSGIQDAFQQFAQCIVDKFDQTVGRPIRLNRVEPQHRGCV